MYVYILLLYTVNTQRTTRSIIQFKKNFKKKLSFRWGKSKRREYEIYDQLIHFTLILGNIVCFDKMGSGHASPTTRLNTDSETVCGSLRRHRE